MYIFDIDIELSFLSSIQKNSLGMHGYMIALETFYSINARKL